MPPRFRDPMVLSDADILAAVRTGALRVQPWEERHLTPNGLDLRVAEVLVPPAQEPVRSGEAEVPGLGRFLVSTLERVTLGEQLAGQLWIRSSYARRGVLASFGKVEAGFDGTLTIGAFNASSQALRIPIGDRFCQLAFEPLSSPAQKVYAQRSGNYQGQQGITLAKEHRP
ncbi:MAG: dCTP deaminase [Halobacteriales archaeon]|nr:dCTP deaminase [Halobacteriales archaeon]